MGSALGKDLLEYLQYGLTGVGLAVFLLAFYLLFKEITRKDRTLEAVGIIKLMVWSGVFLAVAGQASNIYILVRTARQDVVPAKNIAGTYAYRCHAKNGNYTHGGIVTIEQDGVNLRFIGERQYKSERDPQTGKVTNTLAETAWRSDWAAFTSATSVKFTYSISTSDAHILGICQTELDLGEGGTIHLRGTFHQLPPVLPLYGEVDFERLSDQATRRVAPVLLEELSLSSK